MSLDILQNQLQNLSVVDPECLPFRPTGNFERRHETFDAVPRYLFRVFTPKSQGKTDESWTKSMDARYEVADSRVDIFARANKQRTAEMLYRHLRWWKGPDDNLVSWTSSLLFALVYIFYLHANTRDGSTFGNIHLCVVDTSSFPEAVFLRDVDLIRAYRSFDSRLWNFEGLRCKRRSGFSGYYYFGEYLSQGALKIEGKCQIVPARDIILRGLYDVRPEFAKFENWEPQQSPLWANAVIELRESFYLTKTKQQRTSTEGEQRKICKKALNAAFGISRLFESHWRLPIAASFIALAPHRTDNEEILLKVRSHNNRENCSPLRTKTVAYNTLPEVQAYNVIMQSIYKDYCLGKLKEFLGEAESPLRRTIMFKLNENLDEEDPPWAEQVPTLIDVSYNAILSKLRTISFLSDSLHQALEHRKER
ncbi:hypothetical protein AU210_016472 [Fusarium oxysporum f. sp. radicis-cucumerinum]|uniref:DUF7587 domain-containing protein n=1 Tax=Fusarium oxysporum f. sp. radicis-cucumerinum TaxID=327505 RepID=A0A2H3FPK5_FUSOX|nr:hypothetical protein AU210_016472 [Fusarium oxysporum f. sp. radicis-cucumerinum]